MSGKDRSPLTATPTLEKLLLAVRRRLTLFVWMHGLGTVATAAACWLVFAFLADWALDLPAPIRVVHGLVLLGLPLFFLWRDLLRPLARRPENDELAILVERANPDLDELLVSAAQFQDGRPVDGNPDQIQRVLAQAEERAKSLTLAGVFEGRGPGARFTAGTFCAAAGLLLLAASPLHAGIFLDRLMGGSTRWPQRTYLEVDIPLVSELASVTHEGDEILVKVARGSDVPVVVRAHGVVPDEVLLHFERGMQERLTSGGTDTFRTVLRSLPEDVQFSVSGGDDQDRLPIVRLEVLQPPDVAELALVLEPPAYTGLPTRVEANRDVEVLAGTRVQVRMRPDPADVRGVARLLPGDEEIPLESTTYPAREGAGGAAAGDAPREALGFELVADRSLRYRFELVDEAGLSNPDPGLYAIHVLEDRAPELTVLSPGRSDVETVVGGTLSLRVRAEDDFGLERLAFGVETTDAEGRLGLQEELDLVPLDGSPTPRLAAGGRRLEVAELFGSDQIVTKGQQFTLTVVAQDNREPEAQESRSAPLRVRIVSTDELLRRVQDRLAKARIEAGELLDLQREKRQRTEELLTALESDNPLEGGDAFALQSAMTGQRRVEGDARALARELAAIAETVLYARLDEKGGALLESIDASLATLADRTFHPEPWRELARSYADGELGSAGLAGNLIEILALGLELSEDHARAAAAHLDGAQNALDMSAIQEELLLAADAQEASLERLEELLDRLSQWDNFQSVLSLTRDILNRQKLLRQRTQQFASEE